MAKIIKAFSDPVPAMRFIGKKYAAFDFWGEWFANGWFDRIEEAMGGPGAILAQWENGGGYVGLERRKDGQLLEYWIGMFTPAGTPVPEGFACLDFPATHLGTCWIYGTEGAVHDTSGCPAALAEAGIAIWQDDEGSQWSFENCLCPRYTTPDQDGNVILDYCYFAE